MSGRIDDVLAGDAFWHHAENVLRILEGEGGCFTREAGSVLADLAFLTGISYKYLSTILIAMEEVGLVQVQRLKYDEPRQSNVLLSVCVA